MDAAIAGLIGMVIGIAPGIVTFWIGKRSEEKRQIQQFAVQAAMESWKFHCEVAQRSGGTIMPLETYLIGAFKLAQMGDGRTIDVTNARQRIRELLNIIEIIEDEITDYNKRKEQKRAT